MGDDALDMVVIGAGPAGEKGATQAAYFGKRVAIVERAADPGGGTVRTTGVPTKTLRETALYITGFRKREIYGLSLSLEPRAQLEHLLARAAEVVKTATEEVRQNIVRHGIELVHGDASLGPDRTVRVALPGGGSRRLMPDVILIATGSRPFHPPDVDFDDPDILDTEKVLQMARLPRSLAVVGGGPVGCEYGSIFTSLGTEVTLIDLADRLMPFMDAEISTLLAQSFRDMGMRTVLGAGAARVARTDGELHVELASGETLNPDQVLFAGGRAGNTEGLGLAEAGVETDPRGRIVVDAEFRTSAEGIFAAGDVIGPPALGSVSMEQGRVAVCHAFGIPFKETVDPVPPYGVYSLPEAAMVGMTEEAARAEGIDCEVGRGWFSTNIRAVIAGSTEGLVKLVFRRTDRSLLGVHIVGEDAAELIHVGQAVIAEGGTIDRFIHSTFNIPTRSEAYKYAAYDGLQRLSGRVLRGREPAPSEPVTSEPV